MSRRQGPRLGGGVQGGDAVAGGALGSRSDSGAGWRRGDGCAGQAVVNQGQELLVRETEITCLCDETVHGLGEPGLVRDVGRRVDHRAPATTQLDQALVPQLLVTA